MPEQNSARRYPPQPVGEPVVVTPAFLIKGIALVIAAALGCIYLTICLLFYQGQWQLVFHPSHVIDRTPASVGLHYEDVHFDATETGHLQLTGWVVPAAFNSRYESITALICHDNIGSISDNLPLITQLHALGINVFVFDYRAFGKSDWAKPNQQTWYADSEAAYRYLTGSRHIPPQQIVLYGAGLGATAAAHLAATSPAAALIAVNPIHNGRVLVSGDPRSHYVPLGIFFRNDFAWSATTRNISAPTLFIKDTALRCPVAKDEFAPAACYGREEAHYLFTQFPAAKMYGELAADKAANNQLLASFLDEYLPAK